MPTTPDHPGSDRLPRLVPGTGLVSFPPAEKWDDWEEYDAKAWPDRVKRRYRLVPTTCFNCEAGCGLLAYVDKDSGQVRRFEGNPEHPGSRGRNCAKGPATLNQMYDPERILHPLRRSGPRGSGKWEQVSWEEALGDIASRIRRALQEDRHDEIMYHVGRPGEDGFMERVLRSWGVDGHNSHTNICSSGARTGYAMWMGYDRPSADFANARFILLLSAQLESGHYFNPHAQRIIEARKAGGKVATIDPRLSNTAAMSDYWLSPWPGTEAAMLLAIAARLLEWDAVDHDYVRRWVNWEASLAALAPERPRTYKSFVELLAETYAPYTIEYAAEETGVDAWRIEAVARGIADAGPRFASHTWRSAGSGNLGGWQVARCLFFLHVLTGSVGTEGGTSPSAWDKFKPEHWNTPPPVNRWNELIWPGEFPLSHYEMSYLLPHFLKEGRGRIEVYFTRVYNPVWTNPDGFTWMEALTDEDRVGLHVALSPTWSESAWFADYVLPMGVGAERHDTHSYETHAARWLGFRQPVLRVAGERAGRQYERTYEANPGEVWEENEFWIDLSWRIDPDGSLGIRQWYESPNDPSRPVNLDEYYGWMFDNSVPGLPEHAGREGLTPLEYMRKYGAFEIDRDRYLLNEAEVAPDQPGVEVDGERKSGFTSPSRLLEWHSETLEDWNWPEATIPTYLKSHVYWRDLDLEGRERILLPTFRLPTLIHTRSGNAKYLYEISHGHPLWMNPVDADQLGFDTGDLVRISTDIGYFLMRAWRTEGLRPGVVAASHHMGRWRLDAKMGNERWSSALVDIGRHDGGWLLRHRSGIEPFESDDPDSERIWWRDPGVHQNLAFPVHPDPVSGMHAWHQRVRLTPAEPGDRYGDVFVDTEKSHQIYREWMDRTRPGPGPGGLRRPRWLGRPLTPVPDAYQA